ncbi:hypothetical protein KV557_10105 [Kitasatospora aureofaciens]|uniref:hypothetical protein n=1 Tax=Kitasatospora aureofaciens TaxID=1894 RepID=UPI001C43E55C|nr:hypothetical protein [Kitasatospora aureofaciens]MBV6697477.1 hypothetical protein [Kitasatospora aureofaciens]
MTDAPLDLDAIQARTAAATPGPWEARSHEHGASGCRCLSCYDPVVGWTVTHPQALHCDDLVAKHPSGNNDFGRPLTSCDEGPLLSYEDAVFAAAARADVPALLARVRELEAALDRATRSSYSPRHVWQAWADEGDSTLCTTETDARAAAIQIWSESEYDGSDHPEGFVPGWHETAWGLELLDDGEHTGVFVARQDVFGPHPDEPAPSGPQTPA